MKKPTRPLRLITLYAASLFFSQVASAAVILDVTSALQLTDPTQNGRLSRNSIPQDWAGSEPFPGIINPTTAYRYHIFSVNVGFANFVQISIDDLAGTASTFVSAYNGAYLPNSVASGNLGFNINWLGDAGFSGDIFGNPSFFQVVEPINGNLLVVVNTTASATAGLGDRFRILVEGFANVDFDAPIPEPGT